MIVKSHKKKHHMLTLVVKYIFFLRLSVQKFLLMLAQLSSFNNSFLVYRIVTKFNLPAFILFLT